MSLRIRKVGVLGAGVMGSGIAAHLANAGIPSLLLDIVPPKPALLLKAKPAPLVHPSALQLIESGTFDADFSRLADCDWVIEVVKEDLSIKQATFAKLEKVLRHDAVVSSNTSGLSVKAMLEGRSASFRKRFLVTHFFNPVRYMKLLELVAGPETDPEIVKVIHRFGEEVLGKGIVYAKDSTNFIANRIGVFEMMRILHTLQEAGLSIEAVDKIFGPAMGRPKSAIFRTADIVGLDTLIHVATNCYDTLPNDEARETFKVPSFLTEMVKRGLLGEKTGQGFYKKVGKEILVLDLTSFEYRPQAKVRFDSLGAAKGIEKTAERIAALVGGSDVAAKYAARITLETLAYASRRIPEISDDIVNIDRGMRWGFGWELGPFQIWDAIGLTSGLNAMKAQGIAPAPWVSKIAGAGRPSLYGQANGRDTFLDVSSGTAKPVPESDRTLRVEYLRRGNRRLDGNDSATVWDLGDGALLLEFHSKMNSIDDGTVAMMNRALDLAEGQFEALVIGNDGQNYSAGANIMALLMAAKSGDFEFIRKLAGSFQEANQRMRYSPIPVVSAPFNLVLGGGAESAMGANAIQASSELYMGLVEVGVGLIPGGGGNLQVLRNLYGRFSEDPTFDPFPFLKKIFLTLGTAKVSTSAEEAKGLGFLNPSDGVTLNRDFLLSDAKARALGMARSGFRPPRPTLFRLAGRSGAATVDMMLFDMQQNGQITEHDRKIGRKLAQVLTGGDTSTGTLVTEKQLLELELEAFVSLCGEPKSQDRLMAMLETGKPLRN